MKPSVLFLGVLLFGSGRLMMAAPFSESLTAEQREAAGIDRLSATEILQLNQLIELYQQDRLEEATAAMNAEVEEARVQAARDAAAAMEIQLEEAKRQAEIEAAAALEIQVAEAKKTAAEEANKEMESQLAQVREEAQVEAVKEVEAKIAAEKRFVAQVVGPFRGWFGKTRFELDNGQVWIQKKDAVYTVPPDDEAVVVIEDEGFKQYRMIYTRTGAYVQVSRIK